MVYLQGFIEKGESMDQRKQYEAEEKENYAGSFRVKEHTVLRCYTKKQMKSLYPTGKYTLLGEYRPGQEKGELELEANGMVLPLVPLHKNNRLLYAAKGYVKCHGEEDGYILLLQNRVLQRAAVLLLCLLVIAAVCFALPSTPEGKTLLGIDPGAADPVESAYNTGGQAGASIQIPGYKSISIAADTTDVAVSFQNPVENSCYFRISLILDDGTVLYQSELIPPGKEVREVTLAQPMPAGEYAATVKYDTFTLDDQTPLNGANVKITLIVL